MSKKAQPEGAKIKRALPFKLSDEEKARKGEVAADLNKKLEVAVDLKKSEMKKHSERIGSLTDDISKSLTAISEGVERREVVCIEVKNFDANSVEYWHDGEVLEQREMTPADRQLELADKKPNKKEPKYQRMAPRRRGKTDPNPEEERDEEIASVHKLETSKSGASSALDPK